MIALHHRAFLHTVALILALGTARAEDPAPNYSLEVTFQPAGTEEKITTALPNLALEEDYNLTFPCPGMNALTLEAQLEIFDTPYARFELYDAATKHLSAEGRASYTTLLEVTCPIIYRQETTIFQNETGRLSFVLDGPGPKPRKASQEPKDEATNTPVPAEVLDQIEIDQFRHSASDYFSLQLYNPTERAMTLTRVRVSDPEKSFTRDFSIKLKIGELSSLSSSFKGELPPEIGNSGLLVELTEAFFGD